MNREEFNKLYLGKAVHCDTEEKANEFLSLADSVGYRWITKFPFINYNQWERYKEETCYHITNHGLMFADTNYFNSSRYQIIEYQPQPKFKVGDRVRVKIDTPLYSVHGKIGVIESEGYPCSKVEYGVRFERYSWLWFLTDDYLEKVEEPTYEEETIDDIIEEIKEYQKSINILLNRLERKTNESN